MIIYFFKTHPNMYFLKDNQSFSCKKRFPFTQGYFYQVQFKLAQGFWRRKDFFKKINVLSLIFYHLRFKTDVTLLLKGHKSFTQRCLCKVWLQFSLASGSGERKFQSFVNIIFLFHNYKSVIFFLEGRETLYPMCLVLLKLAQ